MHHFLGSVHGLKSSDMFRVPVCRECHTKRENDPTFRDECAIFWMKWAALYLSMTY